MSSTYKNDIGRIFYSVKFPYNKKEEKLNLEYVAVVSIWEDTGKPVSVHFGNGFGKGGLDQEEGVNDKTDQIPYESVQTNFVNMDDYMVKWTPNFNEAQQDSLQRVQDDLWIKYEEKEKQLRIEHIRAYSLKEVKIKKKYNL